MSTDVVNPEDVVSGAPEPWAVTFKQMWDLYFAPEIARRQKAGTLSVPFSLHIAQVLFFEKGGTRILINEEVTGDAKVKPKRPFDKGDPVYWSDLELIEAYDLPDDLLNHGHFTIFHSSTGWTMTFNFLYGRAKALDLLKLARQYLDTAAASRNLGHSGPTVDNLFHASELICKAELLVNSNPAASARTHGAIASAINRWSHLGNINAAFVQLYNALSNQRPNARYGDIANAPPMPDTDSLELIAAMIEKGVENYRKVTERETRVRAPLEIPSR